MEASHSNCSVSGEKENKEAGFFNFVIFCKITTHSYATKAPAALIHLGETPQVAVVLYVFCKSWSSSADKRLLAAAILLFIIGIFKCIDKPSALKRASFNSIVTTFDPAPRTKTAKREVELEGYIQEARSFVQQNKNPPALDSDSRSSHLEQLSAPDKLFVDYAYIYDDRLTILKSLVAGRENHLRRHL
jgi:hypothetical protein